MRPHDIQQLAAAGNEKEQLVIEMAREKGQHADRVGELEQVTL